MTPLLRKEAPVVQEAPPADDPDLSAERDRLIERMTIMQSELGGLFYEMAIRDHIRMDVLIAKAAELQGVDTKLAEVELRLKRDQTPESAGPAQPVAGHCPACAAPYVPGALYCSRCAHALTQG